jgi:hypothetical protein
MPQNKLLYIGLLVIAASALIYVANWITNNIAYFVPIAFGIGCLFIILGLVQESKKKQAAKENPPEVPGR